MLNRLAVNEVIAPLGSAGVVLLSAAFGIFADLVAEGWQGRRPFVFWPTFVVGATVFFFAYILLLRREKDKRRLGTAYIVRLQSSAWTKEDGNVFADVRAKFARTFEIGGPSDWDGRWDWGLSDRLHAWDDAVEDVVKCLWVARRNDDQATANGLFLWCWWSVAVAMASRAMRDRVGFELEVRHRPSSYRGGQRREGTDWRKERHAFRDDPPGLNAYPLETHVAPCVLHVADPASGLAQRPASSAPVVVVLLAFSKGHWGPLAPGAAPPAGTVIEIGQSAVREVTSGPATLIVCSSGHQRDILWDDYPRLAKAAVQQLQQVHHEHPGATIVVGATMPQELPFGIGVLAAREGHAWPEEMWSLLWDKDRQKFVIPRLNIGRGGSVGKTPPLDDRASRA